MTRTCLVAGTAVLVVGTALSATAWRTEREAVPARPATPVLVELFTSGVKQGPVTAIGVAAVP